MPGPQTQPALRSQVKQPTTPTPHRPDPPRAVASDPTGRKTTGARITKKRVKSSCDTRADNSPTPTAKRRRSLSIHEKALEEKMQEQVQTPVVGRRQHFQEPIDLEASDDDVIYLGDKPPDLGIPDFTSSSSSSSLKEVQALLGRKKTSSPRRTMLSKEDTLQKTSAVEQHSALRDTLKKALSPSDTYGFIYVFRDPNRPHLRKIGMSINSSRRKKEHENRCQLKLEFVHEREVPFHKRTEYLIHSELADLCRPYKCKACDGQPHSEWFEMDDAFAKESVNKWVKFMQTARPYDAGSKQLKPFWKDWLQTKQHLFDGKDLNTTSLREKWTQVLAPSMQDYWNYYEKIVLNHPIWNFLWSFFWQISAVVAWILVFVTVQHPSTFVLMIMYMIGTFLSISQAFSNLQGPGSSPKKARKSKD
jgi:hypothetical protein